MKNKKMIVLYFMFLAFVGCGDNLTGIADKTLVPPIAIAGDDITIRTDDKVTLSASKSSDKDGFIIAYSWEENGTVLSTGIELKEYTSKVPGKHVITLKILDNDELNASDTVNIFVILENQAPVADAGADKKIRVGEKITLDGSASSDSDGEIVFYEWKKKDSSEVLSTGVKLRNYTPVTEGIDIIQLKVTDNEGLSHIDYVFISVLNNKGPLANAWNDQSIRVGQSVTLDGTRSEDLDGTISTYSWEESGSILGTGETLIYTGLSVGTHTITLTVVDNNGNTNSDTVDVVVSAANVAPVADAGEDKNITLLQNVTLDASGSSDSDGTIIAYEWTEGGTILGTAPTLIYSSPYLGGHTIVLKVRDNEGLEDTDSVYVTVTN